MSESIHAPLAELRWDYAAADLRREDLAGDPLRQFRLWFDEALAAGIREPNAMSLCTVGLDGGPTARTVLMKDYTAEGLRFFTNYESRKGRELEAEPRAALLFFWKEHERQVQLRGRASRLSAEESDAYFQTRPYESRIGAWASLQSEPIPDRAWLERRVAEFETRFPDTGEVGCVPCPPHWGGYLFVPEEVEFWQGRPGRKHDRFVYRREGEAWAIERHSP